MIELVGLASLAALAFIILGFVSLFVGIPASWERFFFAWSLRASYGLLGAALVVGVLHG